MNESGGSAVRPLAFLNDHFLPVEQLSIPVYDTGFVLGVTVAEQMRTFGGQLFRLDQHLVRLRNSLHIIGVQISQSDEELGRLAQELVEHNHRLLLPGDDLGLSLFVTPGPYAAFAPRDAQGPTLAMHTYPVAFPSFAAKYDQGEALVVTDVQQVPAACWPPELKCRSRMHYYLADQAARAREPGARALLLDDQQRVMEASTANVLAYEPGTGLLSPRPEHILPGITLAVLQELAAEAGVPLVQRDLYVADLQQAAEVFLCSTSPCILPVVRLNGQPVGTGVPGPMFRQLLQHWNQAVGLDVRAQAQQFAHRRA